MTELEKAMLADVYWLQKKLEELRTGRTPERHKEVLNAVYELRATMDKFAVLL